MSILPAELMGMIGKIVKAHNIRQEYVLPDGNVIELDKERFLCLKPLFDYPNTYTGGRFSERTLDVMIRDTIDACDKDLQDLLYQNIVLGGNNMLFPGLSNRLDKALNTVESSRKISVQPAIKHSAWRGGSILSTSTALDRMWIPKEEYDESGPPIVHTRCF